MDSENKKRRGGDQAEMPLCAGFSCRKQQNCELNLDSDEGRGQELQTFPDMQPAELHCSVDIISFGNGSLQASFGEHNLARSQYDNKI